MIVTKRDGRQQKLDLNKIHAVLTWACDGRNDENLIPIRGVSVSQIEMNAQLLLYDGIPTKEIHEILIKAASELISEDYPNYDHVAARLVWFSVRKEAFNQNIPPDLLNVIKTNVSKNIYTHDLLTFYSEEEINHINTFIVHGRDDLFRYAGAEQMRKKYLVQNRKTKKIFESFQFPYILVSMLLFAKYPKNTRIKYIKKYYDCISQHYISLPTPIMAGLRTNVKQFSSCTLIDSGDSLKSINASAAAIVEYASRKAGIGLNIGAIRAEGQMVRNGDAVTTGVLPFAKYFNGALKSCSQGAVRGASATFNFPIWHLEFDRLIELKNNKGTEETRLRTVDYCIHLSELFYERRVKGQHITFFSPDSVPDLYEAFYSGDNKRFKILYEKYEQDPNIRKFQKSSVEVFDKILQERFETGRIYILNADHVNRHSSFYEPIKMTNLCVEITLPTKPVTYEGDKSYKVEDGMIALCTLSAINWGKFTPIGAIDQESSAVQKQEQKINDVCELAVRGLDSLLDYQEYPIEAAKKHSLLYRPLGIGIIGFAHWLAKGRLQWGKNNTLEQVEHMMECVSYALIKASVKLAQEFGAIKIKTKYHDGIMPIHTTHIKPKTSKDWNGLQEMLKKYGIRNATLMALIPSETSSQLANETNGIEPIKDMITIKGSKEGSLPQVAPEYNRLSAFYETLWEIDTRDYLKTIAVLQKYIDQSISTNTSYDPKHIRFNGEIKMSQLLEDLLLAYKLGIKTLYYSNTNDGTIENSNNSNDCDSGACKI